MTAARQRAGLRLRRRARLPGRLAAALLAAALGAGCARRSRVAEPPTVPPTDATGLTVTLAWDAPVDLDLYVTEPGLETVYFANRKSAAGGVLTRDVRCSDVAPRRGTGEPAPAAGAQTESVRWTAPPPGAYRVAVDFIETCGRRGAIEVSYRIVVDVDGRRRERVGRAHLSERNPRAFEFTVGGDQ